jgi:hypothetical protein
MDELLEVQWCLLVASTHCFYRVDRDGVPASFRKRRHADLRQPTSVVYAAAASAGEIGRSDSASARHVAV